jgi:hypothetical protein
MVIVRWIAVSGITILSSALNAVMHNFYSPPLGKLLMTAKLMNFVFRCLAASVFMLAIPTWAKADNELKFIETDDVRVLYFDPAEQYLVSPALRNLLASINREKEVFGNTGSEKLTLLLRDFSDVSTGWARVTPRNRVFIDVAPQTDPYEYMTPGELRVALSAHETATIRVLDNGNKTTETMRRWLHGKVDVGSRHPESLLANYLTAPRANSPLWFKEGSAVFTETWLMGGVGRAQGGYDEMVFRSMVKDGARFYDPLGLLSKGTEVDFQTNADTYLYGARFMNYLALTYGPKNLVAWWSMDAQSRPYFADDFNRIYGLPMAQAWDNWIRWETHFQQENLAALQAVPVTPAADVTPSALGKMSRVFLSKDGGTLYAAVQKPGQLASLVAIHRVDGSVERLHEIIDPSGVNVSSVAFDPNEDLIFYTSNNGSYRNLEAFSLKTRTSQTLLSAARIGDLAFDRADKSLFGIRFNNGLAMLVQIPYPYRDWHVLRVFKAGERPFDLDVSPDGTLLAYSLSRPGAVLSTPVTDVQILEVAHAGDESARPYRMVALHGATPEGFVFSSDGKAMYGSSYFNGVSNIFRFDLESQEISAVSNADIGFFRPQPLPDGRLFVLRYSSDGFVPSIIQDRHTDDLGAIRFLGTLASEKFPEILTWMQASANTVSLEGRITRQGAYHALSEMSLVSLMPMLEGYKDSIGVGLEAAFSDPMGFADVTVNASYSPDTVLKPSERAHVSVDLHEGRWTVGGKWNAADFYDLFGPIKRSRAGYSGYVDYDRPLAFDLPTTMDFVANVTYYGGLDALPGYQKILSPSPNLTTVAVGLRSTDIRSSPGSVDYEAGHEWSVTAHGYGAAGDFIPSLQVEYHAGMALPLDHSSLWLRSAAVVSEGRPSSPLSNVYLGGFGNNYIDSRMYSGAQRYRGAMVSSMPGFDINSLSGRVVGKVMVEWCLPPIRFEHVGSPGFFLNWARPEIFATALTTNPDNRNLRQNAQNIGAQMDFKLQVMNRFPITLSVGAARGFGGAGRGKSEFMVSLLVL